MMDGLYWLDKDRKDYVKRWESCAKYRECMDSNHIDETVCLSCRKSDDDIDETLLHKSEL